MDIVYYVVLDFEATCWLDMTNKQHEIIEFPSIMWAWRNEEKELKFIDRFQEFVKPTKEPVLSDFCKNLTGITQEQVNNGKPLKVVLDLHHKWINSHLDKPDRQVYIMTVGDWDLKTCLNNEAAVHKLKLPAIYKRWINIKLDFKKFYKYGKGIGLNGMINYLGMEMEGRHHSGIDDCHNTSRIFKKMIEDGYNPINSKINLIKS